MDAFGGGVERSQGDFDGFVLSPCIAVQFRLRGYFIFDDYTLDDVARDAGTISYELMCAVAPRVPVFVDED